MYFCFYKHFLYLKHMDIKFNIINIIVTTRTKKISLLNLDMFFAVVTFVTLFYMQFDATIFPFLMRFSSLIILFTYNTSDFCYVHRKPSRCFKKSMSVFCFVRCRLDIVIKFLSLIVF